MAYTREEICLYGEFVFEGVLLVVFSKSVLIPEGFSSSFNDYCDILE